MERMLEVKHVTMEMSQILTNANQIAQVQSMDGLALEVVLPYQKHVFLLVETYSELGQNNVSKVMLYL